MRTTLWSALLAGLAWAGPAAARQDVALVRLELRVTATVRPGRVEVDRGARDGVAEGDRVELFPREGGPWWGTVVRVADRSAEVDLSAPGVAVAAGTRGEILFPRERLERTGQGPAAAPEPAPPAQEPPTQPGAEGIFPWTNADEDWDRGLPLLAQVGALPPEQRQGRLLGRVVFSGDQIVTTDERADTHLRLGTALVLENPFGRGGSVQLDGELIYRATDGPDVDSDDGPDARLDRASYAWGGTRFEATRWEVGRFLQSGMPEFGLLDGVEWRRRTEGGDTWGLSLGFLPDVDPDQHTGEDLQLAGSYQWLLDDAGRVRLEGGFQKTTHDGEMDRDLLVAKVLVVPQDGWDLRGTAWVDFYGSADEAKGASAELTQAWLSTARRWDGGESLELYYRHLAFPELLREEFEPVTLEQLADDHYERLALRGRLGLSRTAWLRGEAGGWVDEDDTGGDLEIGFELEDVLLDRGRAQASAFATLGRFSWVGGARAALGQAGPSGWWELFYEVGNHHEEGFSNDLDDIVQHRIGVLQSLAAVDGWSLTVSATATLWEDEAGLHMSMFLQRSF